MDSTTSRDYIRYIRSSRQEPTPYCIAETTYSTIERRGRNLEVVFEIPELKKRIKNIRKSLSTWQTEHGHSEDSRVVEAKNRLTKLADETEAKIKARISILNQNFQLEQSSVRITRMHESLSNIKKSARKELEYFSQRAGIEYQDGNISPKTQELPELNPHHLFFFDQMATFVEEFREFTQRYNTLKKQLEEQKQ
jgi:hypothetical protein